MCARSDGARQVQEAALRLTSACNDRSLRQIYNETLNEEIPDDLKRLLDKLN